MVNNYLTYFSGGISGMVEIFFIHPIEYYKTLNQSVEKNLSFKNFYKNVTKNNGFRGLYKGLYPRMVGIIPMRTIFWGTLTTSENILHNHNINKKYIPAIAGASAGLLQTIIDCPVESFKTKLMNNNKINRINFHGFIPNTARNIFFATIFNIQKKKMEKYQLNKSIYNDIFVGSISGIIASIITQPFDYLKTQKQIHGDNKNLKQILSEIKNIFHLWRGGGSRLIITCLSMSIGLPVFNFINYKIMNNKL